MLPSRNDLCPCGSGKKYKKCCMLKEKASAPSLTHRLLRETNSKVHKLLLGHAKEMYGEGGIYDAWDSFWAGNRKGKTDLGDSPYLPLFVPWFMYHWYPEGDENPELRFPCEHTVVAQFLKRKGSRLDAFTRRYLERAQREPIGFWQVEAVEPGKGLLLKDLTTDRECFVRDVSGSKTIARWNIILGQVVGLDEEYILNANGPYALPPSAFMDSITSFIDRIKRAGSLEPEDLLEYDVDFIMVYHQCVQRLLNPVLPEIRNTDGEEMVFTTSRYAFDPASRKDVVAKLSSMRDIEHHRDKGEASDFVWIGEDRDQAIGQGTVKGHIKVGSKDLLTECNSRPRDQKLKTRLQESLGDLVEYEDTTCKPLDLDALPEASKKTRPLDLNELPEGERQQLIAVLEKQYMSWLDEKIPALGHRTPREAVKTPEGREKVAALINGWENSHPGMPDQYAFDFNKLRRGLGLEME